MIEQRTKRILAVDDDPRLRITLKHLLRRRGYEVEEAQDGAEALRILQAGRFDLVFLDLTMPKVGGEEVMKQLPPSFLEKTPVVLLTGKDKDQDVMNGYAMGATYYLVKPVSNEKIVDIADYLIGDRHEHDKDALRDRL